MKYKSFTRTENFHSPHETTKGGTIGKSKILARLKAGKSCKNEDINVNKDKGIKPITEYDRTIDGRSESIWQHVNSLTMDLFSV